MTRPRKRIRIEEPQPTYDVPPTPSEWNAMKSYGSFTIIDQEQQPHVFHIGDNIFVLPTLPDEKEPSHLATRDLWIAKIDSIRAQASHNAWMRVQWYYHPEELRSCIPSFQSHYCGSRERILSTHFDIIPTISCNGPAIIVNLIEDDPAQEIPSDGFYYRLVYNVSGRKRRPRLSQVTPFQSSCFCRTPYGPDRHHMHWCSKCQSWFHKDCLKTSDAPDNSFEDKMPYLAVRRKERKEILNRLENIAHCPVMKGLEYGVVGNFLVVSRAKTMLQKIISEGERFRIPSNWMEDIGISESSKPFDEAWRICPVCDILV